MTDIERGVTIIELTASDREVAQAVLNLLNPAEPHSVVEVRTIRENISGGYLDYSEIYPVEVFRNNPWFRFFHRPLVTIGTLEEGVHGVEYDLSIDLSALDPEKLELEIARRKAS